jgi:hypothetical protein
MSKILNPETGRYVNKDGKVGKQIYCGNNALYPALVSGESKLGTRYGCLKKGVGIGMRLPAESFPYEPIDKTKKYCGNKNVLPLGYDRFGNLPECVVVGVGIGKKIKKRNI